MAREILFERDDGEKFGFTTRPPFELSSQTLLPDDTDIPDGHPNCRCTYKLEVTRLGENDD